MIIKYTFATGVTTEVDVFDELGAVITASRKSEHALAERNRYHCISLDAIDFEGEEFGTWDHYTVEDDTKDTIRSVKEAFSHLTKIQQRRLWLYTNGMTLREIAALENTSFQSVSESIEAAKKKFKRFFPKMP